MYPFIFQLAENIVEAAAKCSLKAGGGELRVGLVMSRVLASRSLLQPILGIVGELCVVHVFFPLSSFQSRNRQGMFQSALAKLKIWCLHHYKSELFTIG